MDNSLQEKLNQILNDPQALEQVKSLGGMLGLTGNDTPAPPPQNANNIPSPTPRQEPQPPQQAEQQSGSPLGALGNLGNLGNLGGLGGLAGLGGSGGEGISPEALQMITKLMPMLSSIQQEDSSTQLLTSLRPFLGKERQGKLDQAKKMLQLMKMLPLIKNTGLL